MKKVKQFFSMKNIMLVTAIATCVVVVSIVPTQADFSTGGVLNGNSNITYTLGKVGVGTTNPSSKLHVYDTISNETDIRITGNSQSWAIGSAGSAWGSMSQLFYISNTNPDWPNNVKFAITPAGNVGIGTQNPTAKLHVSNTSGSEADIRITTNSQSWAIGSAGSVWGSMSQLFYISNTSPDWPSERRTHTPAEAGGFVFRLKAG